MGLIAPTLPSIGQQRGDGEVAVRSDLVALLNEFNGNIESANIKDGSIAAADLASGVIKAKTYPASVIATQETRTNTAYGLLTTPDRVQNVVLPTNGLFVIWYQATWQESVNGAALAAIFIGANQLKKGVADNAAPQLSEVGINAGAGINKLMATSATGLVCRNATGTAYTGDVTTGQALGVVPSDVVSIAQIATGACVVFAAAGTYDITVQYKASSGNVVVKDRRLYVEVLDFS